MYHRKQNNYLITKISYCPLAVNFTPYHTARKLLSVLCHNCFIFYNMSHLRLGSLTYLLLRLSMLLYGSGAPCFLLLSIHCMVKTTIYFSVHLWKDSWVISSFWWCYHKHLCLDFCVNVSFHFSRSQLDRSLNKVW